MTEPRKPPIQQAADEMLTVSFRLNGIVHQRLVELATASDRTFSHHLRFIIRKYLLEEEREKANEYLSRVRDED